MNRLLGFYVGSHADDRGRTLAEILRQDDVWLEVVHDHIQWLFPLTEPSCANRDAPLLDGPTIQAFRSDELLRRHLLAAHLRMLAFFGLRRLDDGSVVIAGNWNQRRRDWFTQDTHNSLRITRMLKSLVLLGLPHEAVAFEAALQRLCDEDAGCGIAASTRRFWRDAVASQRADRSGTAA